MIEAGYRCQTSNVPRDFLKTSDKGFGWFETSVGPEDTSIYAVHMYSSNLSLMISFKF